MNLETDSRVHAQAYIHGHTVASPCKVACALIRNLLDDLSAANGEIRHLKREKAELQAKTGEAPDPTVGGQPLRDLIAYVKSTRPTMSSANTQPEFLSIDEASPESGDAGDAWRGTGASRR